MFRVGEEVSLMVVARNKYKESIVGLLSITSRYPV